MLFETTGVSSAYRSLLQYLDLLVLGGWKKHIPKMVVKHGDEFHGRIRIREKTPTKTNSSQHVITRKTRFSSAPLMRSAAETNPRLWFGILDPHHQLRQLRSSLPPFHSQAVVRTTDSWKAQGQPLEKLLDGKMVKQPFQIGKHLRNHYSILISQSFVIP